MVNYRIKIFDSNNLKKVLNMIAKENINYNTTTSNGYIFVSIDEIGAYRFETLCSNGRIPLEKQA